MSQEFSNYSFIFRIIRGLGTVNVVQVAAGDQHGLALTNGSKLYAWGKNEFGQCGLGPNASKVVSTPQVLEYLTMNFCLYIF